MIGIREARHVGGYRIWLSFSNGESGEVDLSDVLDRFPAGRQLKDIEQFRAFYLDEWPTLVWPNGFDLSPEMLYERATGRRPLWLNQPSANANEWPEHA